MTDNPRIDTKDAGTASPADFDRLVTTRPDGNRGACYHGTGDLEIAADAVAAALRAANMICWRRSLSDGTIEVHGVQSAHWYATLVKGLPQRAEWRLRHTDGRLWVHARFREFRWHRSVLLALGILTALLVLGAWHSATRDPGSGWSSLDLTNYGLAALLPFSAMAYLVLGGMSYTTDVWQSVLTKVKNNGGFLEPLGNGIDRRKFLESLALLGFAFVMAVWLVADTFTEQTLDSVGLQGGILALFGALGLVLVFMMMVTLFLIFRQPEVGIRTTPVLPGLMTSVALLGLFAPVFLWQGAGMAHDLPAQLKEAHRFLNGEAVTADGTVVPPSRLPPRLLEQYRRLRVFCWQLLLAVAIAMATGTAIFVSFGVYGSLYITRALAIYQHSRRRGVYRKALRGRSFLHRFRLVFVASWSIFTGLVLLGLVLIVLCAVQGVVPVFSPVWLHSAELSATAVCFALWQPVGGGPVDVLVRVGWVLYALSTSALFLVSVGQLVHERRSDRRRLRMVLRSPADSRQQTLQSTVDAFQCKLGHVRVVVLPEPFPDVSARAFGLLGRERYVQITSACVDYLHAEHVEALLAHELAHHREGHCRFIQVLRWLGRLTFVGDGFVLALQNSWGYEEIADLTVVDKLKVPKEKLAAALRNYRSVRSGWWRRHHTPRSRGVGAHADPTAQLTDLFVRSPTAMKPWERWRRAWSLYRQQYFHGMTLHYWHPWLDERLAKLIAHQAGERVDP